MHILSSPNPLFTNWEDSQAHNPESIDESQHFAEFSQELNKTDEECSPSDPYAFMECLSNLEIFGLLSKAGVLALIIIFTICGNVLVLLSVAVSKNLRSSTHYLIVNLAVADLLLGTIVLPFSATFEITGRWYFGQSFCTIWAAVDVLCCTSSILSLCVISVDRFIGVSKPLAYSTIMVGRRTTMLIVLIWTLSIAISIGPLLGWKEPPSEDPYFCEVNKQLGYVLFSVTGSFYLPMIVIIIFYWKIYKAAIRQTKFLECGQKTTKQDVTLRVHLGGNLGYRPNFNPEATPKHGCTSKVNRPCCQNGQSVASESEGGDISIAAAELNQLNNTLNLAPLARPEKSSSSSVTNEECPPNNLVVDPEVVLRVHRGGANNGNGGRRPNNERSGGKQKVGTRNGCTGKNGHNHHHHHNDTHQHHHNHNNGSQANSLTPSPPSSSPERKLNPGFGKIAKFKRQKKAAKTLAIVVGVFLSCWFPFFFVLPLGALCQQCSVPTWLFNLFFWLGYFNSCLNPIIYGCTSREFQRAFRRILCRKTPNRPHVSRAIFRANMYNNNRLNNIERPSGGNANNGNLIPMQQWA